MRFGEKRAFENARFFTFEIGKTENESCSSIDLFTILGILQGKW
jgi:hypothetical protein